MSIFVRIIRLIPLCACLPVIGWQVAKHPDMLDQYNFFAVAMVLAALGIVYIMATHNDTTVTYVLWLFSLGCLSLTYVFQGSGFIRLFFGSIGVGVSLFIAIFGNDDIHQDDEPEQVTHQTFHDEQSAQPEQAFQSEQPSQSADSGLGIFDDILEGDFHDVLHGKSTLLRLATT